VFAFANQIGAYTCAHTCKTHKDAYISIGIHTLKPSHITYYAHTHNHIAIPLIFHPLKHNLDICLLLNTSAKCHSHTSSLTRQSKLKRSLYHNALTSIGLPSSARVICLARTIRGHLTFQPR